MKRFLHLMFRHFTAAFMLTTFLVAAAIAQTVTDTTVQIPIGTWADYILPVVATVLAAAVVFGLSYLPAPVAAFLKTILTEQLIQKGISWAINMVKGATHDKVLEVDVGNAVVKQAADYIIKYGPKWIIDWLGGEAGIKDRIIARLKIAPDAGLTPQAVMMGAEPTPGVIPSGTGGSV